MINVGLEIYKQLLRQAEFNKTEGENLIELTKSATNMGDKVINEHNRMRELSKELYKLFMSLDLIDEFEDIEKELNHCVYGVDGSYYPIEDICGKWYVPTSVALICLEEGIGSKPSVNISASIEEIDLNELGEGSSPKDEAKIRMFHVETKAILNCGNSEKEDAIVFIDGPIVDPPTYIKKSYIKYRTNALKSCLSRSMIVMGCVKRVRDTFFRDTIAKDVEKIYKSKLLSFINDQYLMAHIFSHYRKKNEYNGSLFTKPINVSEINKFYKSYFDNGIEIITFFFQKNINSRINRIDVPFIAGEEIGWHNFSLIKKILNDFTFPGHDIPYPIILADDKCSVRRGCAEILYDEILTRSKSTDPFNQIVYLQLK